MTKAGKIWGIGDPKQYVSFIIMKVAEHGMDYGKHEWNNIEYYDNLKCHKSLLQQKFSTDYKS